MALTFQTHYKRCPSAMTISLKDIIPTNLTASSPGQKKEKGKAGGQLPDFLSEVFLFRYCTPPLSAGNMASPDQHRGQARNPCQLTHLCSRERYKCGWTSSPRNWGLLAPQSTSAPGSLQGECGRTSLFPHFQGEGTRVPRTEQLASSLCWES